MGNTSVVVVFRFEVTSGIATRQRVSPAGAFVVGRKLEFVEKG